MSTDNCKEFLITQYPMSSENDWKRVKKFKEGNLSIREFENKKDGYNVQVSEDETGKLVIVSFMPANNAAKNNNTKSSSKAEKNSSDGDSPKLPSFDCVLSATKIQKKAALEAYDEIQEGNLNTVINFELVKFLPHNYYFQIGVRNKSGYQEDIEGFHLNCNETIDSLTKEGKEVYIAVCNKGGVWQDDAIEMTLVDLLLPTLISSGGREGIIDIDDGTLTTNDIVAFIERRGMKYVDNRWNEVVMENFKTKVNDNHVWAYPNSDLTPTPEQMWEIVKDERFYHLPIYEKYLDLDMINCFLSNKNKHRDKDFVAELKVKATILSDKEKIEKAVPRSSDDFNSNIKPASKV